MNDRTSSGIVSRRGPSSTYRILLPPSSPFWGALQLHAATEPQHVIDKAAGIIRAMPHQGRDPRANAEEMNAGYVVALTLNRGNGEGKDLAEGFVEQARDLAAEASEHVDAAHRDLDAAERVWELPVTVDGRQLSRGGAADELDEAQAAAARLEEAGDHAHLHRPMPAPLAIAGALAVTGIEFGALYAPLFNPGDFLSLLPLIAFTVAVYASTHVVTMHTGRAIRAVREFGRRRADQLDAGAAHLLSEAATSGTREESDAARATGFALAGKAGPASAQRWGTGAMAFWLALCVLLAGALVTVVGMRIDAMVLAIGRGPLFSALFAAFIGLVVLGILAALVWGFSRGSMLGRRLEHLTATVDESARMLEEHESSARRHLDAADSCLDEAGTLLARGEEVHGRHLGETIGAVQLAAALLRVRLLDPVPPERMIPLEPAARRDVDRLMRQVGEEGLLEAGRIPGIQRRVPEVAHPHRSHRADRPGVVDLAELEPARVGVTIVDDRRHRPIRGLVLGGIAVLLVVILAVAGIAIAVTAQTGTGGAGPVTNASAPEGSAATASPASGLSEGIDYSYLRTTDGRPDHWSCAEPIGVGLSSDAPAGAVGEVRSAIARIVAVSGLPLQYDTSADPEIAVSYVPAATVRRIGGDGDAVGVARTQTDGSGLYRSATVHIAGDDPVNAPGSTTAAVVLLHELMHAVGLGHATATDEVMAPVLDPRAAADLGAGDVAALRTVGCRS
jgi:hypothetical protein